MPFTLLTTWGAAKAETAPTVSESAVSARVRMACRMLQGLQTRSPLRVALTGWIEE